MCTPYRPSRFVTGYRDLYLRKSNIRHSEWYNRYTDYVYGSRQERELFETKKPSKFNRRAAFLHHTHLHVTDGNKLFDILPQFAQHEWLQTSMEMTHRLYEEDAAKAKQVEMRKRSIECVCPFGSSEEFLPVDVQTLFDRLAVGHNS